MRPRPRSLYLRKELNFRPLLIPSSSPTNSVRRFSMSCALTSLTLPPLKELIQDLPGTFARFLALGFVPPDEIPHLLTELYCEEVHDPATLYRIIESHKQNAVELQRIKQTFWPP